MDLRCIHLEREKVEEMYVYPIDRRKEARVYDRIYIDK
jgi:hypothetical protein